MFYLNKYYFKIDDENESFHKMKVRIDLRLKLANLIH